jgi:hypothetical protein
MIKRDYSWSTGDLIICTSTHTDGMRETEFCAVGRTSKWPVEMADPLWVNISNISNDYKDKRRKNML